MVEIIARACGHTVSFEPSGDGHDERRRNKLRRKRCTDCGRAKNQADNVAQVRGRSGRIKKGAEAKELPVGTRIILERLEGGWSGQLDCDGTLVTSSGSGLMGMASKLARKWLQAGGRRLTGSVKE